jgi:hypothetical protein
MNLRRCMGSLRGLILRGKGTLLLNIETISRLKVGVCDYLTQKSRSRRPSGAIIAAYAWGRSWPGPEATLAAGGVRCLGSTCRQRAGLIRRS